MTQTDFARLSRRIVQAGLMDRRPRYYLIRIGWVAAAYIGSWTLAVVFAQVALVAHDLAHRQVFRSRRPSEFAGLLAGNLGIGMSYGWWMDKHTRHHANVTGGRFLDLPLGGHNHQIEHHLFPNMPSPNLRLAQPIVRQFCAEIGVPYPQSGLAASYGQALRHLHQAGAPSRR